MAQPQQFGQPAPIREAIDAGGQVFFSSRAWVRFWDYLTGRFWVTAPAAANSIGSAGQMAYSAGFFYICVATNTWLRVAIATW